VTTTKALWVPGLAALALLTAIAPSRGDAASESGRQRRAACDLFASPRGGDAAPGTLSRPLKSIDELVDRLRPGRVGCLLGGTYVENVSIELGGRRKARLTLRSAPGNRARVSGYVLIRDTADYVTLSHLDVDGHDVSPITIHVYGDDAVLDDLDVTNRDKVTGTHTGSCVLLGREGLPTFRPIVQRSRIHNCGSSRHDHGIYAEFPRRAVIRDNYIYDSPGYGVSMYPDARSTLIVRNVIDGNGNGNVTFSGEEAGGEYSRDYASSWDVVTRNAITNARSRYNVESFFPSFRPVGNLVSLNCVWNAPWGNFGYTDGYARTENLAVDPQYLSRERKDFRLRRGSPCRGVGPSASALAQSEALAP
jgi:hypothetical protein